MRRSSSWSSPAWTLVPARSLSRVLPESWGHRILAARSLLVCISPSGTRLLCAWTVFLSDCLSSHSLQWLTAMETDGSLPPWKHLECSAQRGLRPWREGSQCGLLLGASTNYSVTRSLTSELDLRPGEVCGLVSAGPPSFSVASRWLVFLEPAVLCAHRSSRSPLYAHS